MTWTADATHQPSQNEAGDCNGISTPPALNGSQRADPKTAGTPRRVPASLRLPLALEWDAEALAMVKRGIAAMDAAEAVIESERRKRAGMQRAAEGRDGWLAYARSVAVRIAHEWGCVSSDDLWAAGITPPPNTSSNIFGSVFAGDPRFVFMGYIKSQRPTAHRNLLRVWRLSETTDSGVNSA